ncbi:MAG: late competence development ComFB family protein [Candidatus Omnitrophota bacterium]
MGYRNYMEDAVLGELGGVLENMKDMCKCEKCRQDIVCYALNRLPAKYVSTDLGNAYTKLHQIRVQTKADIAVQLMEGVKIVKDNPRH